MAEGAAGPQTVRGQWREAARRALQRQDSVKLPPDPSSLGPDLSQWEPDLCVQMLRIPAAQNYCLITKLLKQASKQWMMEFLERDGLGVLLESLERLGARGFSSVADTFSQLQCVTCLRAVMNSQVGLEYIVQHQEYTRQLANILMSRNNSVKLQVFELLCALCIYSAKGHSLALDSLNYFKQMSHGRRYRFDLVVHELQAADTTTYQTTLLAFVNCVILGAPNLQQRNRIRAEFFSVGLENVLQLLRHVEDDSLQIQIKVFDDNQAKDEELQEPLSIYHLFDDLYKQVAETPQVLALQSVLLALSQVDPADPESDYIWESLQEVASDNKNTRRTTRKISCARTREFGTQTSPTVKRWVSTKKRESCSVGVQVESATSATPALDLPETDKVISSNSSEVLPVDKTTGVGVVPQAPNSAVEVCRLCKQSFVREVSPQKTQTVTSKTSLDEKIPKPKVGISPTKVENHQKHSFTKIRKSSPLKCVKNQQKISVSIEEPIVKSIILTTSISPKNLKTTNDELISRTSVKCIPEVPPVSVPTPPPLPTTDQFQYETHFGDQNSSPPLPPPLPSAPPTSSFVPQPPPLPPCPPSPPPLPLSCDSHIPLCTLPPPPPPLPSQSQSEVTPCFSPPPPPPPMNGLPLPVCEPLFSTKEVHNVFFPSTHTTKSPNYHTLPTRRLSNPDLKTVQKFNTLPKPSKKMKTLNWTKVPKQTIEKSVWATVTLPLVPVDYSQIEELFCQKPRPKSLPSQISLEATPAISLLDTKRSLAVNIFLKQFKSGATSVVQALHTLDSLPAEKLKGLLRVLPEEHEISLISSFGGEYDSLDVPEKFFTDLLKIPDYALRVQAMLQREECPGMVAELAPQLEAIISTCESLIHNARLTEFLALLLQLGNYLNAGSYAGDAAGFRLNTLPKLLDTRANKPRMTFLHFAVEVALAHRHDLLTFTDDLASLQATAKNPLNSLKEEVKALASAVRTLDKQVKASKSEDILPKFKRFLKNALTDIEKLEKLMEGAQRAEHRLAVHFCEDPNKFQLDECLLLLADFFSKVKQAIVDNDLRKKQEERSAKVEAAKPLQSLNPEVRRKTGKKKIFQEENSSDLVDILMNEIKVGKFKLQRNVSLNNV